MAMKTGAKRTLAIAIAAGLALAPAATGVSFAQDNPFDQPDAVQTIDAALLNQLDANLQGSITINKQIGPDTGQQGTGSAADANRLTDAHRAGEGVEYRLEKVDVDLSTNEGWTAAAGMNATDAPIDAGFEARTQTTGANGQTVFNNLPLGLYRVTETSAPEGLIPGPPFLVYVPMTTENGDAWNKDVVVYPKNSEDIAEKTVRDADENVGNAITYTIRGSIPGSMTAESAPNAKIEIWDNLDAENVYLDNPAENVVVRATNSGGANPLTLEQDTDYTVNIGTPQTGEVAPDTKQEVRVALTEQGRAKVVGYNEIYLDLTANVKPIGDTDGIAVNEARVITNDGGADSEDREKPTNEVRTIWGKIQINKTDGNSGDALAGAEFQVYQVAAGQCTYEATRDNDDATPLTIGGGDEASTFVTDDSGQAIIDGLHVTDYEDDEAVAADERDVFCLVETKAPNGYVEAFEPTEIELVSEDQDAEGQLVRVSPTYEANIENVTDDNFLPNTGGMGVLLLILVGAGVVGAGAYAARRNSAA